MKFIKSINELNEARQAAAKKLFKMVVNGSTSEIEGVKIGVIGLITLDTPSTTSADLDGL